MKIHRWIDVEYQIGTLPPRQTGPIALGFSNEAVEKALSMAQELFASGYDTRIRPMIAGREALGMFRDIQPLVHPR